MNTLNSACNKHDSVGHKCKSACNKYVSAGDKHVTLHVIWLELLKSYQNRKKRNFRQILSVPIVSIFVLNIPLVLQVQIDCIAKFRISLHS